MHYTNKNERENNTSTNQILNRLISVKDFLR